MSKVACRKSPFCLLIADYARTCDRGGTARRWSRELDRGHHSRRPRKRSCDSMMCSSSCARSNPARPLLGLLVWSLSIRRSAARYPGSCALQVGNGVLPWPRPRAFPAPSLRRPPREDGCRELLCSRHLATPIFQADRVNQNIFGAASRAESR